MVLLLSHLVVLFKCPTVVVLTSVDSALLVNISLYQTLVKAFSVLTSGVQVRSISAVGELAIVLELWGVSLEE